MDARERTSDPRSEVRPAAAGDARAAAGHGPAALEDAPGGGGRPATVGPALHLRIPVTLLVVAASAVVAVAATGVGLLAPAAEMDGSWVRWARTGGMAAAAAGLVALYLQRAGLGTDGRGQDPTIAGLLAATTIMAVLAVLAFFAPSVGGEGRGGGDGGPPNAEAAVSPDATGPPPPPSPGGAPSPEPEPDESDEPAPGADSQVAAEPPPAFDWSLLYRLLNVLVPVLLLAGAVIAVLAVVERWRRRRGAGPSGSPVEAGEAEAGLESSLAGLQPAGGDVRARITAAYLRLLVALSDAGAPRRSQEAPYEHLYRVLTPLGVRPGPMHRLAELYVLAQFSVHPVGEGHRKAAVEALEASLAGLGAAVGPSSADGRDPVRQGAPT